MPQRLHCSASRGRNVPSARTAMAQESGRCRRTGCADAVLRAPSERGSRGGLEARWLPVRGPPCCSGRRTWARRPSGASSAPNHQRLARHRASRSCHASFRHRVLGRASRARRNRRERNSSEDQDVKSADAPDVAARGLASTLAAASRARGRRSGRHLRARRRRRRTESVGARTSAFHEGAAATGLVFLRSRPVPLRPRPLGPGAGLATARSRAGSRVRA